MERIACTTPRLRILNFSSPEVARSLSEDATTLGYGTRIERGTRWLQTPPPKVRDGCVVLIGRNPPAGADGAEIVRRLASRPWVCVLERRGNAAARSLMRAATEFIEAPWSLDELQVRLERFSERLALDERQLADARAGTEIVGSAPVFREALAMAQKLAASPAPVMLEGETGTGKELVARLIHQLSERRRRAFVPVNCGCLPADLVENELFGHEAGAFTGAGRASRGIVHQAEGGTLFLDEVDTLPPRAQVALLRFLQEREVRPVGGGRLHEVDVRVVAATNRPLEPLVAAGVLREDLYFRLNVLTIALPPLRERRADIVELAAHFLDRLAVAYGRSALMLSDEAIAWLMAHELPGNVRQLENLLHRGVLRAASGRIELADIAPPGTQVARPGPVGGTFAEAKAQAVRAFERRYLRDVLEEAGGNVTAAAAAAGKDRRAMGRLLKKHGIGAQWQDAPE